MGRRIVSRIVLGAVGVVMGAAGLRADEPVTRVSVRNDAARREIVVNVGPVSIPAASSYAHHAGEICIPRLPGR